MPARNQRRAITILAGFNLATVILLSTSRATAALLVALVYRTEVIKQDRGWRLFHETGVPAQGYRAGPALPAGTAPHPLAAVRPGHARRIRPPDKQGPVVRRCSRMRQKTRC